MTPYQLILATTIFAVFVAGAWVGWQVRNVQLDRDNFNPDFWDSVEVRELWDGPGDEEVDTEAAARAAYEAEGLRGEDCAHGYIAGFGCRRCAEVAKAKSHGR